MTAQKFLGNRIPKILYKEAYKLALAKGTEYALANAEYFYDYILHQNSKYNKALPLFLSSLKRFEKAKDKNLYGERSNSRSSVRDA